MIASVLANVNRKKNSSPFKPEDFMPKEFSHQEPKQLSHERTAQILRHNFESYANAQKVTDR